jgi:hypothetical protein
MLKPVTPADFGGNKNDANYNKPFDIKEEKVIPENDEYD